MTPPAIPNAALSTRVLRIQFAMVCPPIRRVTQGLHVPAGVVLAASARQIALCAEEQTDSQHVQREPLAVRSAV